MRVGAAAPGRRGPELWGHAAVTRSFAEKEGKKGRKGVGVGVLGALLAADRCLCGGRGGAPRGWVAAPQCCGRLSGSPFPF